MYFYFETVKKTSPTPTCYFCEFNMIFYLIEIHFKIYFVMWSSLKLINVNYSFKHKQQFLLLSKVLASDTKFCKLYLSLFIMFTQRSETWTNKLPQSSFLQVTVLFNSSVHSPLMQSLTSFLVPSPHVTLHFPKLHGLYTAGTVKKLYKFQLINTKLLW